MIEKLIEHLSELDDPRCPGKAEHRLIDILVIAVCAVIACAESWEDIATQSDGQCPNFGSRPIRAFLIEHPLNGGKRTLKFTRELALIPARCVLQKGEQPPAQRRRTACHGESARH